MLDERFIDLDELVLLCQSKQAKKYIDEAILCYRAGAFRACIVSTWLAVVFDFIDKLKQLELSGDVNAKNLIDEYEKFRNAKDFKSTSQFERMVPLRAYKDFELISDMERSDLERLLEDRNRCAHPSTNSSEEIYSPAAELARVHLRNVVMHLLRHPPVQGKAALKRIWDEIQSNYFPVKVEEVIVHFKKGPLANPRDVLVKNLVIVLLKNLLKENLEDSLYRRTSCAINGLRIIHREIVEETIAEKLSDLIRGIGDSQLPEVIKFMDGVKDVWAFCVEDVQMKISKVVEQMPESILVKHLPMALDLQPLYECANKRLHITTSNELISLVEVCPRKEFVDRAVDFYIKADNDGMANTCGSRLIVPLIPFFQTTHIERIFSSIDSNPNIGNSKTLSVVLRSIRDSNIINREGIKIMLEKAGLNVTYGWLIESGETSDGWSEENVVEPDEPYDGSSDTNLTETGNV